MAQVVAKLAEQAEAARQRGKRIAEETSAAVDTYGVSGVGVFPGWTA